MTPANAVFRHYQAMKGWHWVAISVVCMAIGRWVIPPGWAYTGVWLLAMLGIGVVFRRWNQRTAGGSN
jgi:hypothetical protein